MNGSELETKNKRNFFSFQKPYPSLQSVTNLRKVPVNAGLVFVVQTEAQTEAQRTKSIYQSILSSVSLVTGFSRLHRATPPFENPRSGSAFGDDIHNKNPEMFGLTALP